MSKKYTNSQLSRRSFLKLAGGTLAAAAGARFLPVLGKNVLQPIEVVQAANGDPDLYLGGFARGDVLLLNDGPGLFAPAPPREPPLIGAFRRTEHAMLVDIDGGGVEPLTEFREEELWSYPRWSPDGGWIAASRWNS